MVWILLPTEGRTNICGYRWVRINTSWCLWGWYIM